METIQSQSEMGTNKDYEYKGKVINGFAMLFLNFIVIPLLAIACILVLSDAEDLQIVLTSIFVLLFILGCPGYFTQQPNEARVMIFFGKYKGTCRKVGFFWVNPSGLCHFSLVTI